MIPSDRGADLVGGVSGGVKRGQDDAGGEGGVAVDGGGVDLAGLEASQEFVTEKVVADCGEHSGTLTEGREVDGDVHGGASGEEAFGEAVPEHFAKADDVGWGHEDYPFGVEGRRQGVWVDENSRLTRGTGIGLLLGPYREQRRDWP